MNPSRNWSASSLGGLAVLLVLVHARAQDPFAQLSTRPLPFGQPGIGATGDIDGDGDLDLLLPLPRGQDRLLLNDGDGVFTEVTATHMPPDTRGTRSATFVDVDGDGDLDLALAGDTTGLFGEQNRLLLNDGAGSFTDVTSAQLPADSDATPQIVAFDVDADGDPDLLCCSSETGISTPGQNRLYLNDGAGSFTDATATHLPAEPSDCRHAKVGDLDGDGDLDFVTATGEYNEPLRVHINDGTGRFVVSRAGALPALTSLGARSLFLADIESDGDLDILTRAGRLTVLVNDGTARFRDETAARLPSDGSLYVQGDFDRDGDVDFTAFAYPSTGAFSFLENDGNGFFQFTGALPTGGEVAADFDGDADLDLLWASSFDILLNDGSGSFFDRRQAERRGPDFVGWPRRAALADVDGDGDRDAFLTSQTLDSDRLLLNDGRGVFTDAPQPLPQNGRSHTVALGDVDGDGDVDAAIAANGVTRLLLGDGAGGFTEVTATHMPPLSTNTQDLELADFDGDGDLDLVEANWFSSSALLLNDGSGRFSLGANLSSTSRRTRAVASVDIDGDGDLDLVFGNDWDPATLFRNDGPAGFVDVTTTQLPGAAANAFDLVAADVDGDGDSDLVFVVFAYQAQSSTLFVNDGAGTFVDATAGRLPATMSGWHVHALDYDGDGDLDLVSGGSDGLSVLENDGQGRFTTAQSLAVLTWQSFAPELHPVAAGDVDDDGDADLLLAITDGPIDVATNLRRQLHFARLVRPGRVAQLDIYAVGRPAVSAMALPFLSAGAGRLPLAGLGVLGLNPIQLLPLSAAQIPAANHVGSAVFGVPATSSLIGAEVFAQAVLVEGSRMWLTNTQGQRVIQ